MNKEAIFPHIKNTCSAAEQRQAGTHTAKNWKTEYNRETEQLQKSDKKKEK